MCKVGVLIHERKSRNAATKVAGGFPEVFDVLDFHVLWDDMSVRV